MNGETWVVDNVTWHWVQHADGKWYAEPVKPSILGALLPALTFGLGLYLFGKSK